MGSEGFIWAVATFCCSHSSSERRWFGLWQLIMKSSPHPDPLGFALFLPQRSVMFISSSHLTCWDGSKLPRRTSSHFCVQAWQLPSAVPSVLPLHHPSDGRSEFINFYCQGSFLHGTEVWDWFLRLPSCKKRWNQVKRWPWLAKCVCSLCITHTFAVQRCIRTTWGHCVLDQSKLNTRHVYPNLWHLLLGFKSLASRGALISATTRLKDGAL